VGNQQDKKKKKPSLPERIRDTIDQLGGQIGEWLEGLLAPAPVPIPIPIRTPPRRR
jgi:hypothetical protein